MALLDYRNMSPDKLAQICEQYEELIIKLGGENMIDLVKGDQNTTLETTPTTFSSPEEYMIDRLKRLYADLKRFDKKIGSVSDTELDQDYYRAAEIQMKTFIGRILGELGMLSEITTQKDKENICVGKRFRSLNDILGIAPKVFGLTTKGKRDGRTYHLLTFGRASGEDLFSALINALSQTYTGAAREMYDIGFIEVPRSASDNLRNVTVLDTVVTADEYCYYGFLNKYCQCKFPPGTFAFDAELEEWSWIYARYPKIEKLGETTNEILGYILQSYSALGKNMQELYDRINNEKIEYEDEKTGGAK